jgi:hypothetical protein
MRHGRRGARDTAIAAHLRMGPVLMNVGDTTQAHAGGCSLQWEACVVVLCMC